MTLKPSSSLFCKILFLSNIFLFIFLASCSDTSDNSAIEQEDENNIITRFFFSQDENSSLSKYVPGNINQFNNEIYLQLPSGADITSLIPDISLSGIATISPETDTSIDFSEPVEFIVTSEAGNTNTYTVFVSLSSESRITEFYFKRSDNQGLEEDLYGEIDETNKRILFDLPIAADIKNLNPTLILDANRANPLDDFPTDFSNIKQYEVIADDDEKSIYEVSVSYDRHVLIEFGRVNDLFSRFRWSLDTNLNNWDNIQVNEYNRVTALNIDCSCIDFFLPEIELLTELKALGLMASQTNTSTNLPFELGKLTKLESLKIANSKIEQLSPSIGNLTKLEYFQFQDNNLKSLPKEIGNLTELYRIFIHNNQITELPSEIGNLSRLNHITGYSNFIREIPSSFKNLNNLENLNLSRNEIINIPPELYQLKSIESIDLSYNQISSIPKELGQMDTTESVSINLGSNNITSIPKELSQLNTLGGLHLHQNSITTVPKELSQLTSLVVLSLKQNQILTLPQEICDMEDLYGTRIYVDDNVTCTE